jgi:signal transduction histidine kinase
MQPLNTTLRKLLLWAACCLAGLGATHAVFNARWPGADLLSEAVSAWENLLLTAQRAPDARTVRVVDFGTPPAQASQVIELLDLLNYAGARAVLLSLDVGRLVADDPAQASALAAAIRRQASVVLIEGPYHDLGTWQLPPAVRQAAAAVGTRAYFGDTGRAIQGIVTGSPDRTVAADHALIALMRMLDRNYRLPAQAVSQDQAGSEGPAGEQALLLAYSAEPGAFPSLPVAAVQAGSNAMRELRGKIVVVGSKLENPMATPFDTHATRGGSTRRMSEVEVFANFAAALAGGQVIRRVSAAEAWVIVPMAVALCCVPLLLLPPLAGYVSALALGALLFPASWLLAKHQLIVFSPSLLAASAVAASALLWLACSLWRSRRDVERLLGQLRTVRLPMRVADPAALTATGHAAAGADSLQVAQAAIDTARENQELTASIIDSLPIAVLLVDQSGRVLAANQRTLQWFGTADPVGRAAGSLLGQFAFYGADDSAQLLQARHHVAEARYQDLEYVIDSRLIVSETTRSIRLLGIQDVSPIKQAINDRADAVDFLTHDLRAPLHGILVLAGWLEGNAAPAPAEAQAPMQSQAGTMRQIRSMTERAIRLADNYVHLLRTAAETASGFAEVNLNDVVEEALNTSRPLAQQQRVNLRDVDGPLCFVRGDYALLCRALVNLLGNALRHAPPGSEVQVSLNVTGEQVELEVRDRGAGFPAHLLDRSVTRYRVGKQPKAQGIGLGLALVDAVARKHGGTLQLSNRPRGGAQVRLMLPLFESVPVAARLAL